MFMAEKRIPPRERVPYCRLRDSRPALCAAKGEQQSIAFFARKRCDQLFAANLTQKGQTVVGKFPQHIRHGLNDVRKTWRDNPLDH